MDKILAVVVLFLSFNSFAFTSNHLNELFENYGPEIGSRIFYEDLALNSKVQELANIHVTHGWGVGVGGGKAYIETDSSLNIKKLTIDVSVGVLGFNSRIKETVTIESLLAGGSLKFYMDGAKKPALMIVPSRSFTKRGGQATIKILMTSGDYRSETATIKLNYYDKYQIIKASKAVKKIKINMRGMNIATMKVGSYSFE